MCSIFKKITYLTIFSGWVKSQAQVRKFADNTFTTLSEHKSWEQKTFAWMLPSWCRYSANNLRWKHRVISLYSKVIILNLLTFIILTGNCILFYSRPNLRYFLRVQWHPLKLLKKTKQKPTLYIYSWSNK